MTAFDIRRDDVFPILSTGTKAAIANLVDYRVETEYGKDCTREIAGATKIALAGLQFDLRDAYMTVNNDDHHLRGFIETTLRIQVANGLTARECQCRKLHQACPHYGDIRVCHGHYESDVPPIDGALLCGDCHGAEWVKRNPGEGVPTGS